MTDDLERLRLAQAAREIGDDAPQAGQDRFVGKVLSSGASLAVGKFALVRPQILLGTEVEGGTISATNAGDGTASVPVLMLGPGLPATNDLVLARHVDHRWVAKRKGSSGGGGGTGTLAGCSCAHPPAVLTLTASSEGCSNGLFHSCTITYKTVPSSLGPLRLGSSAYLGDTSFVDTQTGDSYYYYLSCFGSVIRLSRVFPTSIFGSPFLDSVIYVWTIGLSGNTCSPFSLTNGAVFSGGDPTCVLTLTG